MVILTGQNYCNNSKMIQQPFVQAFKIPTITYFREHFLFSRMIKEIDVICRDNHVDQTHGLFHAIKIAELTQKAMLTENVENDLKEDVICSAFLHDIDDRKYFNSTNYQNAKSVLEKMSLSSERVKRIITMIDLVSFAKNGNKISQEIPYIYYITRYIDRSEAIGVQGLHRSLIFNKQRLSHIPIYLASTPRPNNHEQLRLYSFGRDKQYMKSGYSNSVVDHVFDKLLHLKLPQQIQNEFMINLYNEKRAEMEQFVLKHAATNYLSYQSDLQNEYENNKHIWYNLQ